MPNDFTRYSCQLALPGFNEATQQKLQKAKVLIVGAGGLGCPSALYLTASGIGTIGIADYDVVSASNLHRQVLYNHAEVGLQKSVIACKKLQEQNPGIQLISIDEKITSKNVMEIIQDYDLIIDCTDNFETKYLLNDACVLSNKVMVYGAIYQYEGQVAVFNVQHDDGTHSPNFRDLFPNVNASQIPNCAEGGVMPTLAGIIGCLQANEVIKHFTGHGELLAGKIMMLDVNTLQSRIIKLKSVSKTIIADLPESIDIPVISVSDLKKAIDSDEYSLVDVRTFQEHTSFNIGGTLIPLNYLEKNISLLNFEKPVVLYCATGKRSEEAVKLIKSKFPGANVFSLNGGMKEWERAL
ncbi:thiamine biosynthesis protein [Ginsengibacter hankyongi]|uniref:Molybdopterin-synthase adenylyltransferase n=1 Tax=Ginsengibacter hankyongi TaxID=2607284 RepID=A0A5J5IBC6_9BACT|nr:HesA/MoeB/ThiF family protein [Ginsengibacter hankyongi]KAA9034340.1 thiamine biosynthesis protein [Ginsengibacter hankyongi]